MPSLPTKDLSHSKAQSASLLVPLKPRTARWWLATVPAQTHWARAIRGNCRFIRGQLETGIGGYVHWQVILWFITPVSMGQCKELLTPESHVEPTRSAAALEYVWKEDTRVADT